MDPGPEVGRLRSQGKGGALVGGNGSAYRSKFTGKYDHRVLEVGHNVPQEAPRDFARAVMDADRL